MLFCDVRDIYCYNVYSALFDDTVPLYLPFYRVFLLFVFSISRFPGKLPMR